MILDFQPPMGIHVAPQSRRDDMILKPVPPLRGWEHALPKIYNRFTPAGLFSQKRQQNLRHLTRLGLWHGMIRVNDHFPHGGTPRCGRDQILATPNKQRGN